MSVAPNPQVVVSNEEQVTAIGPTGPVTTTTPTTTTPPTVNVKLPPFWAKIHTLRLLQILVNTSKPGTLPPLPIPGHVTAIIIQNPSSNSASIKIQNEEIPVGSIWTWEAPGPNFDLNPTDINFDTGGQPIIVNYEFYSDRGDRGDRIKKV